MVGKQKEIRFIERSEVPGTGVRRWERKIGVRHRGGDETGAAQQVHKWVLRSLGVEVGCNFYTLLLPCIKV